MFAASIRLPTNREREVHTMLKKLKDMLSEIDDAMEHAELNDHACTKMYRCLRRERKALVRAIRVFEKSGK